MIIIYILFFILGIIFLNYLIPILDECLSLLLTGIEVAKAKLNLKMTEISVKIKQLSETVSKGNPIGFSYDTEEEYEGET